MKARTVSGRVTHNRDGVIWLRIIMAGPVLDLLVPAFQKMYVLRVGRIRLVEVRRLGNAKLALGKRLAISLPVRCRLNLGCNHTAEYL